MFKVYKKINYLIQRLKKSINFKGKISLIYIHRLNLCFKLFLSIFINKTYIFFKQI